MTNQWKVEFHPCVSRLIGALAYRSFQVFSAHQEIELIDTDTGGKKTGGMFHVFTHSIWQPLGTFSGNSRRPQKLRPFPRGALESGIKHASKWPQRASLKKVKCLILPSYEYWKTISWKNSLERRTTRLSKGRLGNCVRISAVKCPARVAAPAHLVRLDRFKSSTEPPSFLFFFFFLHRLWNKKGGL